FLRLRPAMLGVVAAAAFPTALAAIVSSARGDTATTIGEDRRALRERVREVLRAQSRTSDGVIDRHQFAEMFAQLPLAAGEVGPHKDNIDPAFAQYFKSFGGSRFALTIAFAATEEELSHAGNIETALRTLNAIRDEVSGIDDPSREDSIVRAV